MIEVSEMAKGVDSVVGTSEIGGGREGMTWQHVHQDQDSALLAIEE